MTLPVLVLAMVGCGSNFRTIRTDPVCTEYPWFLDADGDGWGDPNTTGIVQCNPDDATGFIVQNNRDCDDSDEDRNQDGIKDGFPITGRVGSLCPADVVINHQLDTPAPAGMITQFSIGNTEYLVANVPEGDPIDGSSVVWPEYARDVCSPEGWGGTYVVVDEDGTIHEDTIDESRDPAGLFVASDDAEFGAVKDHVVNTDFWATWINATVDTSGNWAWNVSADQTTLSFSDLGGFCDNVSQPSDDPALQQLALIKRKLAGDTEAKFCVGNPEQVWGRYFKDVQTGVDGDGDGLPNPTDPDPAKFDADEDGIGDGQEVDVLGTDPEEADAFPVFAADPAPLPAFQTELAYFVCEREKPDPLRFAMHDLPGLDGP